MTWLGLDVGGANIKVSDGQGYARNFEFALWKRPADLTEVLNGLIGAAPSSDGVAVTMTGELADCFDTKRNGVEHILNAVEIAAGYRRVAVYFVDSRFVSLTGARAEPLLAAASNWHVLARYARRLVDEFPAILVDIGSTTTDVIPLDANGPTTTSRTDTERLLRGELLYLGISRTPLSAISPSLPYRGTDCPVAAELFATTADVSILLDVVPEQPDVRNTADGRPLTKHFSRDRMARMICADRETFSEADADLAASFVWKLQTRRVREAIERNIRTMPAPLKSMILSGDGEALALEAASTSHHNARTHLLSKILGPHISSAAPAHAVAVLASETVVE